jgi:cathepsin L
VCLAACARGTIARARADATAHAGTLLVLSEQQLVSCAPDPGDCGGSGGCEGNIQEWAFSYVHNVSGITTEADWPYTGQDDACDTSLIKPAATVTGYVELPVNDYNALLSAVATIGPMAISAAADAWQFYGGGVFSDSCM